MSKDIRWHQRFANYRRALHKLNIAVSVVKESTDENAEDEDSTDVADMLKEGLVQRFEYTFELAWNVMKDYAEYQGNFEVKGGSRDAIREAFKMDLITNADAWMDMLASRKLTTHTYNEETAAAIYSKIVESYHQLFIDFEQKMEALRSGNQQSLFNKD